MAYSILGWGEPLVEVRTEHLPKAMVLDAPDNPGNLDSAAHRTHRRQLRRFFWETF